MNLIKKINKKGRIDMLYFKIGKLSEILKDLHQINQNAKK